MNARIGVGLGVFGVLMLAGLFGTAAAAGPTRHRAGGHAPRPPRRSAPRAHVARPPKLPRAKTPAPRVKAAAPRVKAPAKPIKPRSNSQAAGHLARSALPRVAPHIYTYGAGVRARSYLARGYGRGYRNRYYRARRGYGVSQSTNRAVVARLRSVYVNLARLDHDYQGHRARAMNAIALAIRQLSHRSMIYQGAGFMPGANPALGPGLAMRPNAGGNAANLPRPQPLTQAQSDARMSQALRTTQGIYLQMTYQGGYTPAKARARGHVQRAIREMNAALAIR